MNYLIPMFSFLFVAASCVAMQNDGEEMTLLNGNVLNYRTSVAIKRIKAGSNISEANNFFFHLRQQAIVQHVARESLQPSQNKQKMNLEDEQQ